MDSSATADCDDYLDTVVGLDCDNRMLAARNDFAIPLDRHALADQAALLEQGGDGHWLTQFGALAVDVQENHCQDFSTRPKLPIGQSRRAG